MSKELSLDISESSYTFLETIGKGSFGQVFKCIHTKTGLTVAIKTIDLEKAEDDLEDIQREVKILGQCDCENVTKYYLSKVVGTELWIVMEYLGGGSVFDLLRMGTIEEIYVSVLMREILKGLIYLHGEGKIHRDIKCANILLSENGNVKLADFGVAGQLTDTFNKKNTFVGTPFWMAPEVIKQAAYDFKADIWSLGITLYEMVNAAPPHFEMHPMKALFTICKENPPELNSSFSKNIKEFFLLCVNKNPDFRPDAKSLSRHKFIKTAKKTSILIELLERYRAFINSSSQNDRLNSLVETDSSLLKDENYNNKNNLPDWIFETVRVAKNMNVTFKECSISISERLDSNSEGDIFTGDTLSRTNETTIPEVIASVVEPPTQNNKKDYISVSNVGSLSSSLHTSSNSITDKEENYPRKKSYTHKNLFKIKTNKDKEPKDISHADERKLSIKSNISHRKVDNKLSTILKFLYESQLSNTPAGIELYNKVNSDHHVANKIYSQIANFCSSKK